MRGHHEQALHERARTHPVFISRDGPLYKSEKGLLVVWLSESGTEFGREEEVIEQVVETRAIDGIHVVRNLLLLFDHLKREKKKKMREG